MPRLTGLCLALLATGCLVESDDPPVNQGPDLLGRICTTQLSVSGSFAQSLAAPPHEDGTPYTGCWPIGTWTFSAQIAANDCATPPELLPQYQFRVDHNLDADGNPYQTEAYLTDPTARTRIKVSQGGAGLCEGELNLFSDDGKQVWIIKPALFADSTLGGDGEYALYRDDQWPAFEN